MWVYPKHPCTQSFRSHGLAVGHIQRYRCGLIRFQGAHVFNNNLEPSNR